MAIEFKNNQKTARTYKGKEYVLVAHVTADGTRFTVDGIKGDFPSLGAAAASVAKWPKQDGSGFVVPDGPRFWGLRAVTVKATPDAAKVKAPAAKAKPAPAKKAPAAAKKVVAAKRPAAKAVAARPRSAAKAA